MLRKWLHQKRRTEMLQAARCYTGAGYERTANNDGGALPACGAEHSARCATCVHNKEEEGPDCSLVNRTNSDGKGGGCWVAALGWAGARIHRTRNEDRERSGGGLELRKGRPRAWDRRPAPATQQNGNRTETLWRARPRHGRRWTERRRTKGTSTRDDDEQ